MQQEYLAKPRLLAISEIDQRAGQLPKGSGSFAQNWPAGRIHPPSTNRPFSAVQRRLCVGSF
jgi:hypothetical protein